jgi:carbon starvation protein
MLAAIALTLCLVVVVKKKLERYAWVPGLPALWLVICTMTAAWVKMTDPKIGFPAIAAKYADAVAQNKLLAPAKSADEMQRIIFNNQLDAALTAMFMLLVVATVIFGVRAIMQARAAAQPTANEEPYIALGSVGAH